jgi:hypothetical protein
MAHWHAVGRVAIGPEASLAALRLFGRGLRRRGLYLLNLSSPAAALDGTLKQRCEVRRMHHRSGGNPETRGHPCRGPDTASSPVPTRNGRFAMLLASSERRRIPQRSRCSYSGAVRLSGAHRAQHVSTFIISDWPVSLLSAASYFKKCILAAGLVH